MKCCRTIAMLSAASLALVTGCAGGPPALAQTDFQAANNGMPKPPEGARYTIICQTFVGESHIAMAVKARDDLFATAKPLDKWYVVHSADKSILYYGFYRNTDPRDLVDYREGQRAVGDQNSIRAIADSHGTRFFSNCVLAPIDTPDPAADPKWDLLRSPGFWTVELAVFKTSADRKDQAVAAVKAARAQGIEAYYYHGPTMSSVCVGSWPRASVLEMTAGQLNQNPNSDVVVTVGPTPGGLAVPQGMSQVQPTVQILDPTLEQVLRTFHEHAEDNMTKERQVVDPKTGKTITVDEQPLLVHIPDRVDTAVTMRDPTLTRTSDSYNIPLPTPGDSNSELEDPSTAALRKRNSK